MGLVSIRYEIIKFMQKKKCFMSYFLPLCRIVMVRLDFVIILLEERCLLASGAPHHSKAYNRPLQMFPTMLPRNFRSYNFHFPSIYLVGISRKKLPRICRHDHHIRQKVSCHRLGQGYGCVHPHYSYAILTYCKRQTSFYHSCHRSDFFP